MSNSLVDGFKLPIVISPTDGKGNCSVAGCDGDPRQNCSSGLAARTPDWKVIACRSACDVFNADESCCGGAYADPVACLPQNTSSPSVPQGEQAHHCYCKIDP
ncbi:hypothetical protein SADUNF_Sadunf03G0012300 [Salix dunnii]|uniref:Thaumatin-like protein n=1 Tax=Salix dunnii TaxID=1413687 RepID=A0A835KGP3_9ROSI|nr:hypothetical protein SADUNF_Sadunf03G0012300 [Salix dunnii]